jgi:hypothetical protein
VVLDSLTTEIDLAGSGIKAFSTDRSNLAKRRAGTAPSRVAPVFAD